MRNYIVKRVCCAFAALLCMVMCCAVLTACEEENYGTLCSLEDAYERALISKEDLQKIADIYNANRENLKVDNLPLSEEAAYAIRCAFCQEYNQSISRNEEVKIKGYYGTYNNCVVVNAVADVKLMFGEGAVCGEPWIRETWKIGDVEFYNYFGIDVWTK